MGRRAPAPAGTGRAWAGTAPGQGQAVTQQGTGHRTGGIDPGGWHKAPSTQHPAAGAGHRAPHRQGQHRAPACKGKPGRTAQGQGQTVTASRHRTPAPAGRQGQHLQGTGPHGQPGTGRHRTRSKASGQTARHRHRHQQAGTAQGTGTGKPGRTGGIDPGGWHPATSPPQALARVIGHRAGPGRAGPGMGRQARHRARANRAAQVASIRAGGTQPLALAIGHRKGKARTFKASGRTGQAGTGRHRTRSRASGHTTRHGHRTAQGKASTCKASETGAGKPGRTGGIDRGGWHKAPSTQPLALALALSSGTGAGMGRQAAPGQRQAAKPQGTGHRQGQAGPHWWHRSGRVST
jgi:hypothetical protein